VDHHPSGDHPDLPARVRPTCCYHKAYYRPWWLSPPACAVAEPRRRCTGETRFPLLAQNAHRERQSQCNITKRCTEVCPAGIKITDNAIIPMKERSADQRYDPLGRVLRFWRHRKGRTAPS
jgi:succinate dehydrogenase/fumarate reductase-like Fe-S protein